MTPAQEIMTVYWGGEEVAGFIIFALGRPELEPVDDFLDLGWPVQPELKSWILRGTHWIVSTWDVRVAAWPTSEEFESSMRRVLRQLVSDGYAVAWIGLDGSFADPPQLFVPEVMTGGVLAACSDATGFVAGVRLDEPLRALTDDEMQSLRVASGGLSTAE